MSSVAVAVTSVAVDTNNNRRTMTVVRTLPR